MGRSCTTTKAHNDHGKNTYFGYPHINYPLVKKPLVSLPSTSSFPLPPFPSTSLLHYLKSPSSANNASDREKASSARLSGTRMSLLLQQGYSPLSFRLLRGLWRSHPWWERALLAIRSIERTSQRKRHSRNFNRMKMFRTFY
jgi:hypothetical protein